MKKTILIIEDDPALLVILVDKFRQEGFDILTANNGQGGLNVALQQHPDIILLDIIMPVLDGMTTLATLRKSDWGKNVPVMILTNLSDAKKQEEAACLDVHDYLVKSDVTMNNLVQKIKERLGIPL